jgi:tripartite-type tricarboxylate transporter receptor subunit TctC
MQRRALITHGPLALAAMACGPVLSQVLPAHVTGLIVPYPAGGTIDQQARMLAPALRAELRQDVVVENIPGAAGAIGLQRLLAAPADGRELAIATDSDAVLVPMVNADVRYQGQQFRLLGVVMQAPMVLLASAGFDAPDLRALLDARTAGTPPTRRFANYGLGSNSHLCADDFATQAGMPAIHVPYKGIAPLMQDVLGRHVDMTFLPLVGPVLESIKAGALRAYGVAAPERDPRLPNVPTVAQAGGPAGFAHASWSAVVVQASMPEARARQLHRVVQDSLASATFQRELERSGSLPTAAMGFEQSQGFLLGEVQRYRRLADAWLARAPAATLTR